MLNFLKRLLGLESNVVTEEVLKEGPTVNPKPKYKKPKAPPAPPNPWDKGLMPAKNPPPMPAVKPAKRRGRPPKVKS